MQLQRLFATGVYVFIIGDCMGLQLAYFVMLQILAVLMLLLIPYILWSKKPAYAMLSVSLLFLLTGMLAGYTHHPARTQALIEPFIQQNILVVGKVEPVETHLTDKYARLRLRSESMRSADRNLSQVQLAVNTYLPLHYWNKERPQPGDTLQITGKLEDIYGFNNPGGTNLKQKAHRQKLVGNIFAKPEQIRIVSRADSDSLSAVALKISSSYRRQLTEFLPANQIPLIQALVFGATQGLDPAVWRDFSLTGLIHVLSVSGSHMSLVAWLAFGFAALLIRKQRFAVIPAILIIFAYMFLAGLTLPVVRAGIMSVLVLCAAFPGRKPYAPAIFNLTLLLMVAYNPPAILDLSFQLSFLAAGALIFVRPRIVSFLERFALPVVCIQSLAAIFAVQLMLLPLLLDNFHRFSLLSLLSNIILLPLIEAAIVLIVLGTVVMVLYLPAAKIILVVAALLLDAVLAINGFLAQTGWGYFVVAALPEGLIVIYYLLFAIIFSSWPAQPIQYLRPLATGMLVFWLLGVLCLQNVREHNPRLHFIDVGQGDACLITGGAGQAVLIDTGGLGGSFDIGERVLLPYLNYLGIARLDLLIISHAHTDHVAGAVGLAKNMRINNLLLPACTDSPHLEQLRRYVPYAAVYTAAAGDKITVANWSFRVIHAPMLSSLDNDSLVVEAVHKQYKALFTGDIDSGIEQKLSTRLSKINILKVAHHGSAKSSETMFLQSLQPELAVISCGRGNRFGHPAAATLKRLREVNAQVWRTDQSGLITMELKADKILVRPYLN